MQNTSPSDHLPALNDSISAQSQEPLAEANRRLLEIEQRLRPALESGRPDVGSITQDEFIEFLHPDDREPAKAASQNALRDRHDYYSQYRSALLESRRILLNGSRWKNKKGAN